MYTVTDDWQAVSLSQEDATSLVTWLERKGLGKYVEKIIEATDAERIDDLKILDGKMMEQVIKDTGLKLVSAEKFRLALKELRGSGTPSSPKSGSQSAGYPLPGEGGSNTDVPVPASKPIEECIAICIDRSGSMGTPFKEVTLNVVKGGTKSSVAERTCMEAVKAMFYAFRDRLESMGSGTHQLGLIQFDNHVEELLDATCRLDLFETIVDDLEKRGQTAIYSAIIEAVNMLGKHFAAETPTDLRILVLTDGQNNTGHTAEEALKAANSIGAVVDAIIVGGTPDANLRRIVSATVGECYQINSLGEGFELLEAEGVVSLRARRGGTEKPPFKQRETVSLSSIAEKNMTQGTAVHRAPALAPDLATKAVVKVSLIGKNVAGSSMSSSTTKRVLAEIKQVASGSTVVWMHSGEGVHIFPAPDNLQVWRALIEGPSSSPFEDGVFALNVMIPESYPFSPPRITFETPIYHCNVNDSGKICLDILQDNWNPSCSVPKCLEMIRMMMKDPDTNYALRQWIADIAIAYFNGSTMDDGSDTLDTRYFDEASKATRRDASMTVEEWKQTWSC